MAYESSSSSVEFTLNRAVQQIKQAVRLELDEKDEKIVQLEKELKRSQSKNRELNRELNQKIDLTEIHKRSYEKENSQYMELLDNLTMVNQELTLEKSRNEELRRSLTLLESKYADLETEHDKANHIIRTLVKKLQQHQRTPMAHATSTTGQHHDRIIT
jgi:chromosome segregation ATPase